MSTRNETRSIDAVGNGCCVGAFELVPYMRSNSRRIHQQHIGVELDHPTAFNIGRWTGRAIVTIDYILIAGFAVYSAQPYISQVVERLTH